MNKENIESIYPLSPMQDGMLFHSIYGKASNVYVLVSHFSLHGPLNVSAFKRAWQRVLNRHPVLRTFFVWKNRVTPLQIVHRRVELPWQEQDWRHVTSSLQTKRSKTFLETEPNKEFNLSKAPLVRLTLVRKTQNDYHFFITHHHMIIDGWSMALLLKEVFTVYQSSCKDENISLEEPQPYKKYITWLKQQDLTEAELYWRKALQGFTKPTPIRLGQAFKKPQSSLQVYAGEELRLSRTTSAELQSLAKQHQITLNTLMQGAWALLLNRYSGESDIVFGTVVSGRSITLTDIDSMIGLFINTLPVRVQLSPHASLVPWLKEVHAQQVQSHKFEHCSLRTIQSWSELERSDGRSLFDSLLVFGNYPIETLLKDAAQDLEIGKVDFLEGSNYPLTVLIDPGEELTMRMRYDTDRFDDRTIVHILKHFQLLLETFLANSNQLLSNFSLLTTAEHQQLVIDFNQTNAPVLDDQTVVSLFEEQVANTPNAVALYVDGNTLSYAQLNKKANQLAHFLIKHDIHREDIVALFLDRSPEAVVAILGILKAGAGYMPVDTMLPAERIALMLTETAAPLVLTKERFVTHLPESAANTLCLDTNWPAIETEPDDNPLTAATPDNLAYIIYTSGSTGTPKGAMVRHSNLFNYAWWAKNFYLQGQKLDFPLFTSLSFDLTVTSIYVPLISGSKIVIYGESDSSNLVILDVIKDDLVDIIKLTPAHLSLLKELNPVQSRLRKMILGGEDLKRNLAKSVSDLFDNKIEIYNEYGPTEATVGCMIHRFDPELDTDDSVPIGKPITNAQVYLLDEHLNPVPGGVIGEICIGGRGVARGYLGRPELNAAKFVEVPWQTDAILYRTGDLARWTFDGKMQYLGRTDDQVKVKGYRVELGEIESKLLRHPDIELGVVTVFQPQASRTNAAETHCSKCGLPDNYPGTTLDTEGICNTCRDFDMLKERFRPYFKTMADLQAIINEAKKTKTGKYDCMVLYSGGKDSTYMLYQLVKEMGMTPLVFSHDNGYISKEAKENIRRVTDDLNVDLVFGQTPQMDAVFVDSLRRHKNVCDGCFKVIYTLSINLAREKGINYIFTGLSRGQLFETRLSDMFEARIFDVDEIDRTVLEARKAYHRIDDAVNQLLDVEIFKGDDVFNDVRLVDFYRYKDVPLHAVYTYLDQHAPWVRPSDTGRSTNCLINEVGIYIHNKERGYHNYALPYSWDVRIGHKSRSEALEELDDDIDETRVRNILKEIGYLEPEAAPTQLVAHFTAKQPLTIKALRQFLNHSLPDYMVPTYFVQHEQMPLTTNGKIDREALPDPTGKGIRLDTEYVEPVTEREQKLAKVWAEVFQLESVGVHDNFFDLGGDSIISIQIIVKAGQVGLYFSPQQLFKSQTIATLAPEVEVTTVAPVEQGLVTGPVALMPIAHWFFDLNLPEPNKWNMSMLVDVTTELNSKLLEQALQQMLSHHDMLRARFLPADTPSGWQQTLTEKAPSPTFQVVDLSGMPLAEQRLCVKETMVQLENSHNLMKGRLIAAAYFKGEMGHTSRLFITVHHLVVDGFSWNVLLQDLEKAYHQLSRGESVSLPAKTISMRDWSEKLAELAQTTNVKKELSHWSTVFKDVHPSIPVDIQRGDNREGEASVVTVSLNQKETQSLLKEVPSIYNTQINDFLLTVLAQVLTEWTGQNSVLINLEGHGREDILPTISPPARTIGWFTSIFPVKLTLTESTNPGDKLKAIKEQLRAIPNKGIGFGLLRYLCKDQEVRRQLTTKTPPQVLFNYLGQFDTSLPDTAIFRLNRALAGWRGESNPRTQMLEINTWIVGGHLQANWTYSKNLHHPSTIERLAERYVTTARTLIDHCLSSEAGGVTPSDFPLANLDDKKLDQLANILDALE